MTSFVSDFFTLDFIQRAFIGGILISLCSALLGISLVLKRYSMIGDGLSHVGFGALAVATAIGFTPMYVAIPVVIIAAFFLLRIRDNGKIKGDAAIALISTAALAFGVTVISFSSGANTDVYNYMFGSILALSESDIRLIIIISITVLIMYIFFYSKIFAVTFDETFARATGIKTEIYNMLIAALSAVVIVVGMKMMGAMLISSLIIFPSLTAMRIFKTFRNVIIASSIISVLCFITGMFVSIILNTPVGASIVIVNVIIFCLFTIIEKIISK